MSEHITMRFMMAADDSPLAIPEIGILMAVELSYDRGVTTATSAYDEFDRQWTASVHNKDGALLGLLAARLGVALDDVMVTE